ncbi:N-acetyltransferase DgcN [Roseibium sp. MMSF_3412]|uniref:N-acetyltransferase DgcN n=1 Tax=Roseibium sp. MMSF_3412 TaxID=3046712 RepID=UPI00273D4B48|nr:N-acetyltransferase DgcN [Roseibium sp. MMSF_3412]
MEIAHPYLLFLGDVPDALAAKTAIGIVDWRKDWCLGQVRLQGCAADTGLPDMKIAEGAAAGAKTMIIGAVNAGGRLPDHWVASVIEALDSGMDVASGLHVRLGDIPAIREAAERNGRSLHDVRHNDMTFATGKGTKRQGKRILAVGTDCSVGKKYTALAMDRAMNERGYNSTFCATGQTGVFISGRGVALDAVVADFISGAAEWISPETEAENWQIIEGQGSLFHPSFAGVTLGLLHGSQPDGFIVCHEPTRTKMRGVETPLPTIQQVIDMTIQCGRLTNPDIRCIGIAVNTAALDKDEALAFLAKVGEKHGLPATDPVRFGMDAIVDKVSAEFGAP